MFILLVSINTLIFLVLSGLHFYWATGGKRGLAASLPSNPSTQDFLFKPSILATLVVAFGLLLFAIVTLGNAVALPVAIDQRYYRYSEILISIIFLLRAVGDFKYVGFFKRIRETYFAKMDSKFYSPLCLTIFIVGLLIFLLAPNS